MPWYKRPEWRKASTPVHILVGLVCGMLCLWKAAVGLGLFAFFTLDEIWSWATVILKGGDPYDDEKDFWEGLAALFTGLSIIGLLWLLTRFGVMQLPIFA